MNPRSLRTFATQLELRAAGDGRTISGLAVPYNLPTQVFDLGRSFMETIAPGAFTRSIAERGHKIRLLQFHEDRRNPLGPITAFDERADGLHIEAHISDTQAGNDVLALVRDGALDGLSIGFSVPDGGDEWPAWDQRIVREAALCEVSCVNMPAYDTARILAVRSASGGAISIARARLELLRRADLPNFPHF